ncbi:MAG: isoprenylcysteine carboxylmethyltransferase family protein [Anaerolineales bacterium]|nr:isoprenylcysteine carboxylmethyltransferase family protein [Anaerolineales bacterium]
MWKPIAFVIATGLLVYISRASLRQAGSHGFYRFFAWESILVLFLLNVEKWFVDPFSWHQLIAWTLLIASLAPLAFGVQTLRGRGQPTQERPGDPSLLAFEKTTTLVTSGIYAYIRHPLYSSLLLLAWGIFFKAPNLPGGLLALVATTFLIATARADEQECIQFFGSEYQEYMQKTKRFIPFLF